MRSCIPPHPLRRWLLLLRLVALLGVCLPAMPTALAQSAPSAPAAPTAPVAPSAPGASANTGGGTPIVNLQIGNGTERENVSTVIEILFVMTILTLAPSVVMLMTSFTRIVIVLGFVRTALGVPTAPANQIVIGIALFVTFFIMAPVWNEIQSTALEPYMAEQIGSKEALDRAITPLKAFMLRQTRASDLDFFVGLAGMGPTEPAAVPIHVVLPAFVLSEIRTAFQMGFLIFIPFIVIDFIVSSVLMTMGMMMMPPTVVSLPFKLMLFVLVDGWQLVIRSLIQSFGV